MRAIITYGSYVEKKQNLFLSVLGIVALDTLVARMAGLAMFPAVFAEGFNPEQGPGLAFLVLPSVFSKMAGGPFHQPHGGMSSISLYGWLSRFQKSRTTRRRIEPGTG